MLASFEKAAVVVSRQVGRILITATGGVILSPSTGLSTSLSSSVSLVSCQCSRAFSMSRNHSNNYHRRDNRQQWNSQHESSSQETRGGGGGHPHRGGRRGGGDRGGGGRGTRNNTLAPVRVSSNRLTAQEREEQLYEMGLNEYRQEYRREVKEHGDPLDEPNAALFSKTFGDYVRETEEFKEKIKTRRMTKKHFEHMNPFDREISLLTWAEKEAIRYLHESDPEQWTPEAVAQAFPISAKNVKKIVESSMRLKTVKEVELHDQNTMRRLELIEKGEIEMTEELEGRLKIRRAIPLKVGHLGMNPEQFIDTGLPKVLGEFAKLVAPKEKGKEGEGKGKEEVVVRWSEGEICEETPPEVGEGMRQELSPKQLRKILPVKTVMTFAEFEERMEKKGAGKKAKDMKYLLEELGSKKETSSKVPSKDVEMVGGGEGIPEKIQKYKKPEETGQLVEIQVEGEQAYLYQPETGYQKPYNSSSPTSIGDGEDAPPEKIIIPAELRKPGATFKVGNSYYDQDGEFLYRVI